MPSFVVVGEVSKDSLRNFNLSSSNLTALLFEGLRCELDATFELQSIKFTTIVTL